MTITRILLSNVWLVISLGLALFVPQVKFIISPMGCLAAVFIFVFPGMFDVFVRKDVLFEIFMWDGVGGFEQ